MNWLQLAQEVIEGKKLVIKRLVAFLIVKMIIYCC